MNSSVESKSPSNLAEWTEALCVQDLPIFSRTAQNLYRTLDDDVKGVSDLSAIILQDPNLTTKLLKISNSPFYNPSRQNMTTVSRAIIFLGSNVIRELTVACSFFEAVLSPENKEQANQVIGDSILAAVQAKEIAISARLGSPESVFVATLLNNIGAIAFWCFSGKHSQRMAYLLKDPNNTPEKIEQKILGFKLDTLTSSLCKTWKLGGLIDEAINNPESKTKEIQFVKLGKEVAHAISFGWDSKELQNCIKKVESVTGQSAAVVMSKLKHNTDTACQIAKQFGAKDASDFIEKCSSRQKSINQQEALNAALAERKQIQFKINQEIEALLSGPFDITQVFEKILEGIHYGVGVDRTLFSLLTTDKLSLKEKFSLGWQKDNANSKLDFKLTQNPSNLFFESLQHPQGFWANPLDHDALFTLHIINTIGNIECLLMPVYTDHKPIGLIYADRAYSRQHFSEEEFKSFKHFAQQAATALTIYRTNNKTNDK